jgi:hypothetical protein
MRQNAVVVRRGQGDRIVKILYFWDHCAISRNAHNKNKKDGNFFSQKVMFDF